MKNSIDILQSNLAESIRQAPHNLEAEQVLIGAILINNEVLNNVSEFLIADHFYEPAHKNIYKAINNTIEKGISASPISLRHIFDHDESLSGVGGGKYLTKLASLATTIINVSEYARLIYNLALRRELIVIGEDIVNQAYSPKEESTATEQIERAEGSLFNLAFSGTSDKSFINIATSIAESLETINRAIKSPNNVTGITSGLLDLDNKLAGFHKSDLVILAGRPSMGKTAFAINLAVNACENMVKDSGEDKAPAVGVFSLEMSSEQLTTRILSMQTQIDSSALKSGKVPETKYNDLRKNAEQLSKIPLFIDDTPALSISAIRTRARRLKRKHNLGILFIDYLQLVRGTSGKSENRVAEVSEVTQGLKALAKELDIPVIALSQLSRAVEQREDKRPMLSDLRESGSIEQDADIVMFIYRDSYYLARKEPAPGSAEYAEWQDKLSKAHNMAEIIIAKHRNGPVGTVQLFYDTQFTKFGNLADPTRDKHG